MFNRCKKQLCLVSFPKEGWHLVKEEKKVNFFIELLIKRNQAKKILIDY